MKGNPVHFQQSEIWWKAAQEHAEGYDNMANRTDLGVEVRAEYLDTLSDCQQLAELISALLDNTYDHGRGHFTTIDRLKQQYAAMFDLLGDYV